MPRPARLEGGVKLKTGGPPGDCVTEAEGSTTTSGSRYSVKASFLTEASTVGTETESPTTTASGTKVHPVGPRKANTRRFSGFTRKGFATFRLYGAEGAAASNTQA